MVQFNAPNTHINLRDLLSPASVQWSPATQVIFPKHGEHNVMVPRWNIYEEPTFRAIVRPGSEEDVQKAVRVATSNDIPFLATGGQHGYSTSFGNLDNGIDIDLSNFNTVQVDAEASVLTVGGGVIARDIYDPLYEAGKELQTGSCSCVGLVGSTLGGGVGRYSGLHGLIIDALLEVRLVTATGDAITVSNTTNDDLWWGMLGAGFNFGIVTEAKYRVADLTNKGQVQSADLVFPASAATEYFKTLTELVDNQPAALSAITIEAFDAASSEAQIICNLVYPGPEDEFKTHIQPFLDLNPLVQVVQTIPWNKLVSTTLLGLDAQLCVKGQVHSIYGTNVRQTDTALYTQIFNEMNDFYKSTPNANASVIVWEHFPNQAVKAVPTSETAYPWRDAIANIMLQMSWTDDSVAEKTNCIAKKWRSELATTSGYGQEVVYVSYAHSDETPEEIYGESLPRLIELKKQWDPKNVFAFNNPIP